MKKTGLSNYSVILSFLIGVIPFYSWSQLPNCQIYMMDYAIIGDSVYFDTPLFLSSFNPKGYNNQPQFFSDQELYITTNYYDADRTDIVKLNMVDRTLQRVTKTVESEYSPSLTPDGNNFSVIRVEKYGNDQSLHQYPLDQSNSGRRLLKDLKNVGYHIWLSQDQLGLFLVEEPIKMVIADLKTGRNRYLLDNVGRCLKRSKEGDLVIVHKLLPNKWYLKIYDPIRGSFKIITETLPGKEDFEILPDGSFLMARDSKVFRYPNKSLTDQWYEVDDFSDLDIENITRISSSKNKIVLVTNKN